MWTIPLGGVGNYCRTTGVFLRRGEEVRGEIVFGYMICTTLCKQAGTLRTAATPKGQITEELPLLPPRAIYGECKAVRLTHCDSIVSHFEYLCDFSKN